MGWIFNNINNINIGGTNKINNINTTIGLPPQEKMSGSKESLPLGKVLFISHSSKDKDLVDPFVDMLLDAGFPRNMLFYSSNPASGVFLGEDINKRLHRELVKDTFVIFMLSKNWNSSAVCGNELGAAWHGSLKHCNILLPGFHYRDIGGIASTTEMSVRYEDGEDMLREMLGQLIRQLENHFDLKFSDTVWEKSREKFLRLLRKRGYTKTADCKGAV